MPAAQSVIEFKPQSNELQQKLEKALQLLSEVKTIGDAKKVADMAYAAEEYAKRQRMGIEAINFAHAVKIDGRTTLGAFWKDADKNEGTRGQLKGRDASGGTRQEPLEQTAPTLAELGLTKNEAVECVWLCDLLNDHPPLHEEIRENRKTISEVHRMLAHANVETPEPIDGIYRVLYADPPWEYGSKGLDDYGHAERHYGTMSTSELCRVGQGGDETKPPLAQQIIEASAEDSVLFLWTTSPMLPDAIQVIEAWGFEYKASMVWDKVRHNYGNYVSVRHEYLLIATKGSCLPDVKELHDSVVSIQRTHKHSEKPAYFRELIDKLYPNGNRIEVFAREAPEGWDTWGNQAPTTTSTTHAN
ncbi:MAG: hypothetical protein GY906_22545 [bacterium]|nr:hypothetical protein [bacterium]